MERWSQVSRWAAVSIAWALSAGAQACSPTPDSRPFGERLRAAKLAFIGEVEGVSGRTVTFQVQHALVGKPQGERISVEMGSPSTCSIQFVKGQRWIFGGVNTYDPSLRLDVGSNAKRVDGDAVGRMRREDDRHLKMPDEYKSCETDSQCTYLPYACSTTAVNKNTVEAAKKHVFGTMRVARPEVVSCATEKGARVDGAGWALCRAKRCGSWQAFWE